jgi:hypothetical protein
VPLQVLKQKRLLETQRDQLFNQQFNMEQTSFALESMKDSAQTVAAMKQAGQELKQAFKSNDLNISSIEKLQDEMADYMVRSLFIIAGVFLVSVSPSETWERILWRLGPPHAVAEPVKIPCGFQSGNGPALFHALCVIVKMGLCGAVHMTFMCSRPFLPPRYTLRREISARVLEYLGMALEFFMGKDTTGTPLYPKPLE